MDRLTSLSRQPLWLAFSYSCEQVLCMFRAIIRAGQDVAKISIMIRPSGRNNRAKTANNYLTFSAKVIVPTTLTGTCITAVVLHPGPWLAVSLDQWRLAYYVSGIKSVARRRVRLLGALQQFYPGNVVNSQCR